MTRKHKTLGFINFGGPGGLTYIDADTSGRPMMQTQRPLAQLEAAQKDSKPVAAEIRRIAKSLGCSCKLTGDMPTVDAPVGKCFSSGLHWFEAEVSQFDSRHDALAFILEDLRGETLVACDGEGGCDCPTNH